MLDADTLPSFASSISTALSTANAYFPVTTLGIMLGLVMAQRVGMVLWRLIVFIYQNFPAKAT